MLGIYISFFDLIFDFGIGPTVWYFIFFFSFYLSINIVIEIPCLIKSLSDMIFFKIHTVALVLNLY